MEYTTGTTDVIDTVNTADISAQKAALRKQVLKRRDAFSVSMREQKSVVVCQHIVEKLIALFEHRLACDTQHVAGATQPTIGLFSSLGSEVNLSGVVCYARQAGWNLAFPVMFTSEHEPGYVMRFVQVSYDSALKRTQAFLAKPAKNIPPHQFNFEQFPLVSPQTLDALAVPLVAFDTHGGRLGYGGGNYDRYVPQLRGDCCVFGVAFSEQCVPQVPQNAFDHAIPCVVHA